MPPSATRSTPVLIGLVLSLSLPPIPSAVIWRRWMKYFTADDIKNTWLEASGN
jgi:hypothetical protein